MSEKFLDNCWDTFYKEWKKVCEKPIESVPDFMVKVTNCIGKTIKAKKIKTEDIHIVTIFLHHCLLCDIQDDMQKEKEKSARTKEIEHYFKLKTKDDFLLQ